MINDTTHNFNPEHFNEGLYEEFRRSDYFNYTKFLEDRALEVEQAKFNEQVARDRVEELEDANLELQSLANTDAINRKEAKRQVEKLIDWTREIMDML